MEWTKFWLIGTGGFLGANVRYFLGEWLKAKIGSAIPWQTMIVNVSGAFVIGFFLALALRENWNPNWRLFLAVGVLGGYTTYSTFAVEGLDLLSNKLYGWGLFYILGSAVFTVLAAWIGRAVGRAFVGT